MTTTEIRQNQEAGQQVRVEGEESHSQWINVGSPERKWSTYAGAALVVLGLARGKLGGLAMAAVGGSVLYRGITGHCPIYQAVGITTVDEERDAAQPEDYFERGIHLEQAVTVNKSPEELYRFWRDFTNLPRFMKHLEEVSVLGDKRSHWIAKGPAGSRIEWDAEIINEEENAIIAWRSLGGAEVDNAGSVRFVKAPHDRGTEVRVVIDYIPPAGRIGSIIARLFGEEPQIQVKDDLRRFKQLMETGEVPTVENQPRGSCGG
jgi:uncharacterized membrane protein